MIAPQAQGDCVTILMAVYNGADCLEEQLQSLLAQDHPCWHLVTSDDGSRDDSPAILADFADQVRARAEATGARIRVSNLQGPGQGGSENFLFLLRQAGRAALPGWIAFSDQDDVWLPDRLSRGLAALRARSDDGPALYCSRTWVSSSDLGERRLSAPRPRPTGFRNALVQNIASGNTILLNPAAADLVSTAVSRVPQVVVHDWWVYQLVSGAGGEVVHDDEPTLLYRQHAVNQIGANDTFWSRLKRVRQLLRGDFRDWNRINVAALRSAGTALTPPNRALLEDFARLPDLPLPLRLHRLSRLGLYRQSTISTVALWVAALLRRL
ncbi:glycosyltransferase family 2 protein [Sulfitobacter aestuarii]|uniref:Glycosyltransferase family 2 protein n=1 Tax=Sulfitobacter aestuarii TaxID=2161676 RepID=A0ABW5U7B6_9RHOB